MEAVHKIDESLLKSGAALNQDVKSQATWSTTLLIGLTVVAIAIAIGFGIAFVLSRSIAASVSAIQTTMNSLADKCATWLADGLRAVARGDLTVGITPVTPLIEGYGKDELGQLAEKTNQLRNNI